MIKLDLFCRDTEWLNVLKSIVWYTYQKERYKSLDHLNRHRNANQDKEISPHTCQNGYQKAYK